MNLYNLNDLHDHLKELELDELAQELALVRYKATMWDKYTRESRIQKELLQAIEVTENTSELKAQLLSAERGTDEYHSTLEELTDKNFAQAAAESGGGASTLKEDDYGFYDAFNEQWDWCADIDPKVKYKLHTDTSGATYTGFDDEDVPGTARKGEN